MVEVPARVLDLPGVQLGHDQALENERVEKRANETASSRTSCHPASRRRRNSWPQNPLVPPLERFGDDTTHLDLSRDLSGASFSNPIPRRTESTAMALSGRRSESAISGLERFGSSPSPACSAGGRGAELRPLAARQRQVSVLERVQALDQDSLSRSCRHATKAGKRSRRLRPRIDDR